MKKSTVKNLQKYTYHNSRLEYHLEFLSIETTRNLYLIIYM